MANTFDRTTSFEQPPAAKRAHVAAPLDAIDDAMSPLGERRASAFGGNAQRIRSFQEEAAVAPELRSRLESIGMRTRFNVNRGYGVPPSSMMAATAATTAFALGGLSAGVLVTEREILHRVNANRSAFARTQSAPLYANELQPFAGNGVRPSLLPSSETRPIDSMIDENEDPLAAAFFGDDDIECAGPTSSQNSTTSDLKRSREVYDGDDDEHVQQLPPSVARQSGLTGFGANRNMAITLPASAGLSSYLADSSIFPSSADATSAWKDCDFTTFSQTDNF